MQSEASYKLQSEHLDAVRRGAAFAICMALALVFVWPWTSSPSFSSFLERIHTASHRAAEIANAPATISRPWLPLTLTGAE